MEGYDEISVNSIQMVDLLEIYCSLSDLLCKNE